MATTMLLPVRNNIIYLNRKKRFAFMQLSDDGSSWIDNTNVTTWSSSDNSIFTIDAFGVATGHIPGNAVITATYNGEELTAQVVVSDAVPESISLILRDTNSLIVGHGVRATGRVTFTDGNEYSSGDNLYPELFEFTLSDANGEAVTDASIDNHGLAVVSETATHSSLTIRMTEIVSGMSAEIEVEVKNYSSSELIFSNFYGPTGNIDIDYDEIMTDLTGGFKNDDSSGSGYDKTAGGVFSITDDSVITLIDGEYEKNTLRGISPGNSLINYNSGGRECFTNVAVKGTGGVIALRVMAARAEYVVGQNYGLIIIADYEDGTTRLVGGRPELIVYSADDSIAKIDNGGNFAFYGAGGPFQVYCVSPGSTLLTIQYQGIVTGHRVDVLPERPDK